MANHYCFSSLIGGGGGALDNRDGADLSDGDTARVVTDGNGNTYNYHLDADSGLGEDSPFIIAPDDNPGTKRWILADITAPNTNAALSSMLLTGGEITNGTIAGTIKVAALTAMLRTGSGISDPLVRCSLVETDNITLAAADIWYHIKLTYGSPCTIATAVSGANGLNIITIGHCLKEDDDVIHSSVGGLRLTDGMRKLHRRAVELRNTELASGGLVSDPGTRNLYVTPGVFYRGINRYETLVFSTLDSGIGFDYYYWDPDGTEWIKDAGGPYTQIDNVNYNKVDTGSGLAALSTGKYTTNWIFMHPDDEEILILYGRSNTLLSAAESEEIPESLPGIVADQSSLICKVIIQEGSDDLIFENVKFFTFTPQVVVDHNELSGLQGGQVDQYNHLTDAEIAGLGGAAVAFGRPIILTPQSNCGPAADFATRDTIAGGSTPAEVVSVLDFDPDATEYADFKFAIPVGYAGGGLTVTPVFSMTSDHDEGASEVRWEVGFARIDNDGIPISGNHAYDFNGVSAAVPSVVSEVSYDDITFTDGADMDSAAAGEMVLLRIRRKHDHADDNATGDAELQMIMIKET